MPRGEKRKRALLHTYIFGKKLLLLADNKPAGKRKALGAEQVKVTQKEKLERRQ